MRSTARLEYISGRTVVKKGLYRTHARISELSIKALEEVLDYLIVLDFSDNVAGLPLLKRLDAFFHEADNKIR